MGRKRTLTLAARVGVVEPQACLASVGDGIATSVKITRASLVANGSPAASTSITVDGGNCSNLARREIGGRGGGGQAEGGDNDGESVHLAKWKD